MKLYKTDSAYVLSEQDLQNDFIIVTDEEAQKIKDWYLISVDNWVLTLTKDTNIVAWVDPYDVIINYPLDEIQSYSDIIQSIKPINIHKAIADRYYWWDLEKDDEYTQRYLYLFQKEVDWTANTEEIAELQYIKNWYELIQLFKKIITTL